MNRDEENFQQLRRLLALKRYEQPPPRYFNDFSARVATRIRLGDPGETYSEHWFWEVPWLMRLWATFETNPVLAGAFGAAVCALLISGVVFSPRTSQPIDGFVINLPEQSEPGPIQSADQMPAVPSALASMGSSTNGVFPDQPHGSLFDQVPALHQLHPQLVNWPTSQPGN